VKHVDFFGLQLDPDTGAVAVVLRERGEPGRVVPIVVGGMEAVSIAAAVSGDETPRPSSHDLMASLVSGTGAHVDAVEVTELRDGTFIAEIAVSGPVGEIRLDSRPSDAIALALRVDADMFVAESILDEAGFALPERPDEEQIAAELEEFRARLDEAGADAFAEEGSSEGPGGDQPGG
jgi:bifunctional DNase/RNase